jgi:hypothetical protein
MTTDNTNGPEPSPAEVEERLRRFLTCPVCGYDGNGTQGGGFRFLEDITVFRQVLGVASGLLEINGVYETDDGYDDGTGWRIECRRRQPRGCGHEWAIPQWLLPYLDWVG